MRFKSIAGLLAVLLVIGLVGCSQVMPTKPEQTAESSGDIPLDQIPPAFRNVNLKLEFNRGFSKSVASDSTAVVTFISNCYRTDNGLNTAWGAREWPVGDSAMIPTLNGRKYNGMPQINGYGQIGVPTFTIGGVPLQHVVSLGTWIGYFAEFSIMPNDSLGWEFRQGGPTDDEFILVHYVIADPAPQDYQVVEVVGTQTSWNNRFATAIYDQQYGQWDVYLLAKRGEDVAVAFFGDGQLIRTKFIYAQTPAMDQRVTLQSVVVVANPATTFAKTPWFTSRAMVDDKPVFFFTVTADGAITQASPAPPAKARIILANSTLPSTNKIWCRTNLAHNGEWFQIPRSGGRWQTPVLNLPTMTPFYLQIENRTSGQFEPKLVSIGNQTLVHIETVDDGVAFTGSLFEGPVVIQGPDNLDVPIGKKS